ncbi:UvrD-helicase domain-containing protein [Nocardioides yefusunii]|uniref:DNA 3'-5' helicase n=1 Tax=Nocardioides yefusunii TaxID=2500546 RepID=A0ABW1QYX4_9ACTN|nr:UvrD-helicase domain-containing protein [Nocardioides yefusunii]
MSSATNLILAGVAIAAVTSLPLLRSTPRSIEDERDSLFRDALATWAARVRSDLLEAEEHQRWITLETLQTWSSTRPVGPLPDALRQTDSAHGRSDVSLFETDLDSLRRSTNDLVVRQASSRHKTFFDTVLGQPLSTDQAAAVAATENRLLVVGPAGSGKTSLLAARAAWTLRRGIGPQGRVLFLTFDQAAADDARRLTDECLGRAGVDPERVQVRSFGEFARDVVEQARGTRPRAAEWTEGATGLQVISEIATRLRDEDEEFRRRWDTYRLLFARPTTADPATLPHEDPAAEFTTLAGEVARSRGERMLADWLVLNGIDHRWRLPYPRTTSTLDDSQYCPDLRYPGIDLWHEHVVPDAEVTQLHEGPRHEDTMEWRRRVHERHGSTMIETVESEVVGGWGLKKLSDTLINRGVTPVWNPDALGDHAHVRHDDLVRLVRSFMTQVKSTGNTRASLDLAWRRNGRSHSTRLFLDLYWPIHEAWQARLEAEGVNDAEDDLTQATTALESGLDMGFTTVLLDDAQDVSGPRARMVRALVERPERHLLAVGDDWQSVHRFAGADLSVLTDFRRWFGPFETMSLPSTFRSPQTVTDTAAEFVQRNPRQVRRTVRSTLASPGEPVQLVRLGSEDEIPRAVASWLNDLSRRVTSASVLVLGRYGFEQTLLGEDVPANLQVRFSTVHDAKGREADHVLLPRMVSGDHGFPSDVPADPVLDLVVSNAEGFRHAEERRLFHVALTRARSTVTLMTVQGKESAFVTELARYEQLEASALSTADDLVACPACRRGSLVRSSGPHGPFLVCSTAPACRHTQKIEMPDALEVASA